MKKLQFPLRQGSDARWFSSALLSLFLLSVFSPVAHSSLICAEAVARLAPEAALRESAEAFQWEINGQAFFARRVGPWDAPILRDLLTGISRETMHARFNGNMSPQRWSETIIGRLERHWAVLAFAREGQDVVPIGLIELVRVPETRHNYELGQLVTDAYQGRGVGKKLVDAAVHFYGNRTIEEVRADFFGDKPASRALYQYLREQLGLSVDVNSYFQ